MTKKAKRYFLLAGVLAVLFSAVTVLAATVDVQPIGPEEAMVGLAAVNGTVFHLLGASTIWYDITEWIGIAALAVAALFAGVGLCQLMRRRSLRGVDRGILILGAFYGVVAAVYLLFELVIINYRPVLIDGALEASYPSSHTMLVACVLGSAAILLRKYFPKKTLLCRLADTAAVVLSAVTAVGRLLSGMHWLTDIVGSMLISAALIALFRAALACAVDAE